MDPSPIPPYRSPRQRALSALATLLVVAAVSALALVFFPENVRHFGFRTLSLDPAPVNKLSVERVSSPHPERAPSDAPHP